MTWRKWRNYKHLPFFRGVITLRQLLQLLLLEFWNGYSFLFEFTPIPIHRTGLPMCIMRENYYDVTLSLFSRLHTYRLSKNIQQSAAIDTRQVAS